LADTVLVDSLYGVGHVCHTVFVYISVGDHQMDMTSAHMVVDNSLGNFILWLFGFTLVNCLTFISDEISTHGSF